MPVVDLQAHLFAEVQRVGRVVPCDGHSLAVDETVEPQRRAQGDDLLHHLLHLAVGQRHFVQPIFATVVLEEDLLPVCEQVCFAGALDDLQLTPATLT
ncbi:hypothetical protein D3C79_1014130 [compost metagenome]